MELLPGQVAVVTGAASGIGRALAGRLGALGLDVVLADVEEAALERAVAELAPGGGIGGAGGGRALAVPTDVADPGQVERLAEAAVATFGAVDVVCNNAGVSLRSRPSWRATADDWTWVLGVNLLGVANGLRSFVPRLLGRPAGHVVNVASLAGLTAAPFLGPYTASKHAVVALTEVLRAELAELAPHVGVTLVCPGMVATRIAEADRNRPAALGDTEPPAPEAAGLRRRLLDMLARATSPEAVADRIVEAIAGDRPCVLTDDATPGLARAYLDRLLAEPMPGPGGVRRAAQAGRGAP